MSFKEFSKISKNNKEFSIDSDLTSEGILVSYIVIYNGDIAPFKDSKVSVIHGKKMIILLFYIHLIHVQNASLYFKMLIERIV